MSTINVSWSDPNTDKTQPAKEQKVEQQEEAAAETAEADMSTINVSWSDPNTYKTQPAKKQKVEQQVEAAAETAEAVTNGATDAIIRGGVHKSKDPRDHATVDYKTSDGTHITTKHVHMKQP